MNVPNTAPLSASLPRAEAEHGDLDARILWAEQRLVTREENLHRSIRALGMRVRRSLRPWRRVIPAVAVGAALWGVLRLIRRRRRPASQEPGAETAAPRRGHDRARRWMPMMGMVWPLLPAQWRARVHPTLTQLMFTLGLPLLEKLLAQPELPALTTAGPVDRSRLTGLWYELGRFSAAGKGPGPVLWRHSLREDGGIDLAEVQGDAQGRGGVPGVAFVVAGSGGAQWRISHWPALLRWLPMAWHDEAVLHLDDAATELLLGSPGRDRLRLLARQPQLPPPRLEAMLALAKERGFPAAAFPDALNRPRHRESEPEVAKL